jgi:two-component system, NtrC family, sensor kinase
MAPGGQLRRRGEAARVLCTMNIRFKVISLLVALFAVLATVQFLVQQRILLPSFAELEQQAAKTDMERVVSAIRNDLEQLAISARDWGNWSEIYAFAMDRKPTFITDNFNAETLKTLKVNALAIIDLDGKFVWAGAIALDTGDPLDIDFIAHGMLPAGHTLRAGLRNGTPVTGLLKTNQGPMLAALSPVLDGAGQGPHRGMVMLGRLLTREEVMQIGARAQVNLTMTAAPESDSRSQLTTTLTEGESITVVSKDLADIAGLPLLTMRIEVPRTISERGRATIAYASVFFAGAGIAVLLLLGTMLHRSVLDPLDRMTRHAVAIGQSDDLTSRLDLKRTDELGKLAKEFDRMVERLAAARRELVDQSFDAGIAEMASGVLHNVGNAMTPLSIKATLLQERLRATPVAEFDIALAELGRGASDPVRQADLVEFLQLSSRELARALTSALADVDAMVLQTVIMQKSLAEQMQFSRHGWVMETVRLPELIHHCSENLPTVFGQRLAIEIDGTLEAVGAVRLARTTLQQVFQNVMLNAVEAVRDASPDRGWLRISSSVEADADRERLRIRFSDNGVGIPAEHLTRIFEKGFSTKSRETHFGVGLHWSANAMNALGGSIRAESAGHGNGATIELILPLQRSSVVAEARAA